MTKPMTLHAFLKKFPDADACLEHLMRTRYGERHACSKCAKDARYYRVRSRKCYECEHCGFQVYPMAGTAFEKSRTGLDKWFLAMHMFTVSRNGVSAKEIQRAIGVTYKCAWRMAREIRLHMAMVDGDRPLGGGNRMVEVDKTFIGGIDPQERQDKAIVIGLVERGGDIVARHIPRRTKRHVNRVVAQHVRPCSRVSTDEANVYGDFAADGFRHQSVRHAVGEYVRGDVHTNTLEGFWSLVKRSISGTYVSVSKKHLQAYLGEFEFRWNLRKAPHLMLDRLLAVFPPPAR